jgi:AraC-like DNA-binding protein
VRTLYLAGELGAQPGDLHALDVPPLLRELVLHAVMTAPLRRDEPEHVRLVGVIVDQLRTVPQAPLRLPFPSDPRARALADAFLSDPGSTAGIDELARRCGASRRTLERLFVVDVGASIGAWRRRCRLVEALRLLADGRPVTAVAHDVGYSTPSAFGAMFRAELGVAPRDYFA